MPPARKSSAPADAPAPNAPSGPSWFRYVGHEVRTYLFAGAPAVTAVPDEPRLLPADPGDGAWEPCSAPDPSPSSTDTAE